MQAENRSAVLPLPASDHQRKKPFSRQPRAQGDSIPIGDHSLRGEGEQYSLLSVLGLAVAFATGAAGLGVGPRNTFLLSAACLLGADHLPVSAQTGLSPTRAASESRADRFQKTELQLQLHELALPRQPEFLPSDSPELLSVGGDSLQSAHRRPRDTAKRPEHTI